MRVAHFRRALATAAALVAMAGPAPAAPDEPSIVVARDRIEAVDGDSVRVDGREWRLRGFDTPETDKARCEGERRLGSVAMRRLEALIAAARELRVVGGSETDRWRRPLGDLLADGVNVREILVGELLARPYNGGLKKGWCSRDSRDDLIPGPLPAHETRRGN